MSKERFAGIWRELTGWIVEAWGEWIGNSLMVAAGKHDQIFGRVQQDSANEREQAARQLRDFQHHNRNWFI